MEQVAMLSWAKLQKISTSSLDEDRANVQLWMYVDDVTIRANNGWQNVTKGRGMQQCMWNS
eukprot:5324268-Amphidinium_carterae.1